VLGRFNDDRGSKALRLESFFISKGFTMIKAGIAGVTGYTGIELYRLLRAHPAAQVSWLTSESSAGQRLSDVFPCPWEDPLVKLEDAPLDAVDVVFLCLPHAASISAVAQVRAAGTRAIDLSADFRLHSAAAYRQWYGLAHNQPLLLAEAVYGLPELHRARIAAAGLIANPGCYPTSIILALAPMARAGWLRGQVIADSKSGVSGAGRQAKLSNSFVEVNENFAPYNIGYSHRHIAEMEQELWQVTNAQPAASSTPADAISSPAQPFTLLFSPHLLPVSRGILSTLYVSLPPEVTPAAVRAAFAAAYATEPFIHLLPEGQLASLHHVVHSNRCAISLTFVPGNNTLIITSVIDNLLKGASGQAVQNMNCMYGLDETLGLLYLS